MLPRLFVMASSLAIVCPMARADWPCFRGPTGQGNSDAVELPIAWSETENVAWKTAIPGSGWSSPVILNGQVWLTTALEDGRSLRAVGVDAKAGTIVHNVEAIRLEQPIPINPLNTHASPTPVVEPGRLFVHFGTCGTAAIDTHAGKILWVNRTLTLDHKEGPGSSPAVAGDMVLLNCDGMDAQFVAGLDKRNGNFVWRVDRTHAKDPNPDFRKAYSTPLVVVHGGQMQLISCGADHAVAYDPSDGRALWMVRYKGFSNVPTPVHGHGLFYICTGYMRPQLLAVRGGGSGDVTGTHVAWSAVRQVPNKPSPILVGDNLFLIHDGGVLTCLNALSGRTEWSERLGGNYSASPVAAENRIYFCAEDGRTSVVAADRAFRRIATNQLDGMVMASPAIADRAIFVRTDKHLYRLEDAAKAANKRTAGQNAARCAIQVAGRSTEHASH